MANSDFTDRLIEELIGSAEVTGSQITRSAAMMMIAELYHYPAAQVFGALARCRRELKPREFTLQAILTRLDDGRPGPEEAWASMPKSESESAVLTQEQLIAWGICVDLFYAGDKIAARMAFKEAYARLISEARVERRQPEFVISLGTEKSGRAAALAAGASAGRITAQQALARCPDDHYQQLAERLGVPAQEALPGASDRRREVGAAIAAALTGKVQSGAG